MKANKKTLKALKYVLKNEQEYWDFEQTIGEVAEETGLLKHKSMGEHTLSTDECGIEWGKDEICNLEDFINNFSHIFLEKICNIADSMIGEDIDCYLEEE